MSKSENTPPVVCPTCSGGGTVQEEKLDVLRARNEDGSWETVGRTVIVTVPCKTCGGSGRVG